MHTSNRIKLFFPCLIGALLALTSVSFAQSTQADNGQYFRYFVLQADALDDGLQAKVERATQGHDAIKMVESCSASNQLLFSVKADYPHRINAIASEIESIVQSESKKLEVRSVTTIPLSEISNFCN